jgi:predicted mannosyl-3-phosphoglycerate phosphatase (HAD superfamily)
MEYILNYRSSLTLESKKRIVHNGNIFYIPIQIIKSHKIIIEIQNILLDDFTRLITEGIDREEKKLGAILILTGLVEVSYEAAYALPHLIQD